MIKWYEKPGPECAAVVSSRVSVSRNLRGVPFPALLEADEKRRVAKRLHDAAFRANSEVARNFQSINLEKLRTAEAVAMAERGILRADFVEHREGRYLLLSPDESQSVVANGEDHFLIQVRAAGLCLQDAYAAADRLDTFLDDSLHFAYDKRLGYLTSNPAALGTGMLASLELHLPALADTGAVGRIASNLRPLGLSFSSALHPHGSVFRLSNRMTLGISERDAVSNLCGIARQIIAQEYETRKQLIRSISVQDTVERSLSIFRSARLLGYEEFLDLASVIRFGAATGFETSIRIEDIDSLAMRVQPACLTLEAGMGLTENEERALRASIVRTAFAQHTETGRGEDGSE